MPDDPTKRTKRVTGTKGHLRAGRPAEVFKITGPWEAAVGKALRKKKPPGGWPQAPAKARRRAAR